MCVNTRYISSTRGTSSNFLYLVFTCMPGESYRRRLRSLLCLFQALISSLACWFCMSALGLVPFQVVKVHQPEQYAVLFTPHLCTTYAHCYSSQKLSQGSSDIPVAMHRINVHWFLQINVRIFEDIQVNNWVHVLKAIFTLDTDIFLKRAGGSFADMCGHRARPFRGAVIYSTVRRKCQKMRLGMCNN